MTGKIDYCPVKFTYSFRDALSYIGPDRGMCRLSTRQSSEAYVVIFMHEGRFYHTHWIEKYHECSGIRKGLARHCFSDEDFDAQDWITMSLKTGEI
jgi:hypothetical protein